MTRAEYAADVLTDWLFKTFDPGDVLTGTFLGSRDRKFLQAITGRLKNRDDTIGQEWLRLVEGFLNPMLDTRPSEPKLPVLSMTQQEVHGPLREHSGILIEKSQEGS